MQADDRWLVGALRKNDAKGVEEELTTEEVAAVLGLSVAAVKSRLHRARLVLRKALTAFLSPVR